MDIDQIRAQLSAIRFDDDDNERDYLGASEIGAECSRQLWLSFHKYSKRQVFDPRITRLFHRGKREEIVFDTIMERLGAECISGSWSQEGFRDGFFAGHTDGVWMIDGSRICVEYKTHGAKSFSTLVNGLPAKHMAQCILYPGYLDATGTLYLAVNKDSDDLFAEWIPFDPDEFERLKTKADYITRADKPPERCCKNAADYRAKLCNERNVCFGLEMPRVSCMNCTSLHKYQNSLGCDAGHEIGTPCEQHSFNPYALNSMLGLQPIEFYPKERAVEYRKADGSTIINGAAPFGVPSDKLEAM